MTKLSPVDGKKLKRFEIPLWEGINTLVADHMAKRSELAFIENARSTRVGYLEKRAGYVLYGNNISATANYGLYDFSTSTHIAYRVSTVSATTKVFYYNAGTWTALTGAATGLTAIEHDFATAFNRLFIVNGTDNNFYIESNGTTAVAATDSTGMLYNSPKAKLVNYYKERLYLGDYLRVDATRERTGICFSSEPVGIVSTVNGDHSTTPMTIINVTDTKYIKVGAANDSLDIYRGGTLIGTVTVTAKTENTLTVSSFSTALKSSDEIWVAGTHDGAKVIRWDNRATGINTKTYDSFKNTSEEDLVMLTNVGSDMIIFTKNSISIYNGTNVRPLDLDIGCVSKKSFVKILGQAIFAHYTGLFTLTSGVPRLISAKVQQLFDNASAASLEASTAAAIGYSYFITMGNISFYKNDGSLKSTLSNVVLEYNLRQNNFYVHTSLDMTHFTKFKDSTSQMLLFAKNSNGNVYRFLSGTDDAGTAIKFNVETHENNLGTYFETIIEPRQVIFEVKLGHNIGVFVAYDDGPFWEIGQAKRGINIIDIPLVPKTDDYPRCQMIKFAFREYSGSQVVIARPALQYYETDQQEDNRQT